MQGAWSWSSWARMSHQQCFHASPGRAFKEYAPQGRSVPGHQCQPPGFSRIAEHAREARLPFSVLKDAGNRIADEFGAQRTPEAFLLDGKRVIRYHGRIDDQFGVGYKLDTNRRDLAVALDELLAGRK